MKRLADHIDEDWSEPSGPTGGGVGRDETAGAIIVTASPLVSDDLPARVPISRAELEVIETYFGSLIDELLDG
jgi:hypothetical protein